MTQPVMEANCILNCDSDDDLFLPKPTKTLLAEGEQLPKWTPLNLNNNKQHTLLESVSSENEDPPVDVIPVCKLDHANRTANSCGLLRHDSIVDGLLEEIYDRWHGTRHDSFDFDSDTFTECSSTSEIFHRGDIYSNWSTEKKHNPQLRRTFLQNQSMSKLYKMRDDLKRSNNQMSTRLVRQLKRRDRNLAKQQRNFDIVTAVIQAASLKRRIDTQMRFSIEPLQSDNAFDQWKDAMKAVARLPMGVPGDFRKRVWLSLADNHIKDLRIDWDKTVSFAFNEKSNPDDNKLGLQIVKDLHRTGCTSFSGHDNVEDRAVLKRVLLAYARWNKRVGYCQGFNIIAALLLDVVDRKEDDALKVMVYLIDHVLPESYFADNLRALSVDMAVFRDLLRITLPELSNHLDYLQHAAQDQNTGACYEPPLTNVFTMQWFLTLFATCLPKSVVLRVLDSVLLEGSEILLRTALTIWGILARRIMNVPSADEFYSLMGDLSAEMIQGHLFNADSFIKSIYSIAPFPFPNLMELREKYTYNIRPFTNSGGVKSSSQTSKNLLYSDDDELDEDDIEAISCFPGMEGQPTGTGADISSVGPGAYGASIDSHGHRSPYMERMSTDIHGLKKQYERLRQRQKQAHIIIAGASVRKTPKPKAVVFVPKFESPTAMNHLFLGKSSTTGKNRIIAECSTIAPIGTKGSLLQKQVYKPKHSFSQNTKSVGDTVKPVADTCEKGNNSSLSEPEHCLNVSEGNDVPNESKSNTITADNCLSKNSQTVQDSTDVIVHSTDNGCDGKSQTTPDVNDTLSSEEIVVQSSSNTDVSYDLTMSSNNIPLRKSKHSMMLHSISRSVNLVEGDNFLGKLSCMSKPRQHSLHSLPVSPSSSHPVSPTSDPEVSTKPNKPFNPFPTRYINSNRKKTGLKLGLYSASTLNQLYKNN